MTSARYDLVVRHRRRLPTAHAFEHRMGWWLVDLAELPTLDAELVGFGWNRAAPVAFHDRDHLGDDDRDLQTKVHALLEAADVTFDERHGRVRVLTQPRSLGYVFNPVSFWWCHRADGSLAAIVVEINNTFGETRPQVLVPSTGRIDGSVLHVEHRKELHVSPFLDLGCTYRYRISVEPDRHVIAAIDVLDDDGTTLLQTSAVGSRHDLSATDALRHAGTLTPQRITTAIHAHAVGLWRAGTPFHHKPPYRADIGSVPTQGDDPTTTPLAPTPVPGRARRPLIAVGRRLLHAALRQLPHGRIDLVEPDGSRHRFGSDDGSGVVELRILDDRFFVRLLQRPRLAFGEGRSSDEWRTDDLPTCLVLLHDLAERFRTARIVSPLVALQERVPRPARPRHRSARDSARADIAYHYDLGNDLYERFLDPTMAYSSAWFSTEDQSLEDAQVTKFERLCDRLDLHAADSLLEIGCGWGGFAVHAAATRGCRVTAVTLSHEQAVAARQRVADAGLADKVTIVERDYRDITGTFDKIASIEMIEAVGHDLDEFFATCDALLAPGGQMAIQAITKPDQRARRTRQLDDGWIERYIFPGSLIPSITNLTAATTRSSSLVMASADEFGGSYARTLAAWRERFDAHRDDLAELGYGDEFARTWDYYLATAEAGFRCGYLRVFHLGFARIGPPADATASTPAAHPVDPLPSSTDSTDPKVLP